MNKEFIENVREMRRWQKEYFKTRDYKVLAKAKNYEKSVDEMLKYIEAERHEGVNQSLFK